MKTLSSFILAALTLVAQTGKTAPSPHLFAAAAMTKAQKNSSIPTDSGIFLRTDDGEWVAFGPKIQAVSSATVDPSNPEIIFLACGNGIIRSRDGGVSWRLVTDWKVSDVAAIVIDPIDGNRVYASTGWGLWKSVDGGDTWKPADNGLTETFSKTLLLDAIEPERLLVGTAGGLYVSIDGAETWSRITDVPSTHILRLRRGVADPKVWLAVTEGHGAWISHDDGTTWTSTAPSLDDANLYGAAVDPIDSLHLAVAGWGVGTWVSADGGSTWFDRTAGLPTPNVFSLAFDPTSPGRLWASTFEEGTFYSDDFGKTWIEGGLVGALVNDSGFINLNL